MNGTTNQLIGTTFTNGSGYYLFTQLDPGTYKVKFTCPTGYVFSPYLQATSPTIFSDANWTLVKK